MADEKEVWRFEPYDKDGYGDIVCGHGNTHRLISKFLSPTDAERIIKAVNGEPPAWTTEPPSEQGEYWHWNGDDDCAPVPTIVLRSGTSGTCFVESGQLGLIAYDCKDHGGWWLKMQTPLTPKLVNGESPVTRFKSPKDVFSVSRNPETGGAIVLLKNTKYETSKITLGKVSAMQMALELLTQTNQVAEAVERLSMRTQTPEG